MKALGQRSRVVAAIAIVLVSSAAQAQTQIGFGAAVPVARQFRYDFNSGYHVQAGTEIALPFPALRLGAGVTYDRWSTRWGASGHSHTACALANPTFDDRRLPVYFLAGIGLCQNAGIIPEWVATALCWPGASSCQGPPPSTERVTAFGYDAGLGARYRHLFAEIRLMRVASRSPRSSLPIAVGFRF